MPEDGVKESSEFSRAYFVTDMEPDIIVGRVAIHDPPPAP